MIFLRKHLSTFALIVLAGLVVALYLPYRDNPPVFDDLPFFMADKGGLIPLQNFHLGWLDWRSLAYSSLTAVQRLWPDAMAAQRVVNLMVHLATCLALYGLVRTLARALSPQKYPKEASAGTLALLAVALFSLHPVATYAVGYLVQRSILMATLFSVLAAWACAEGSLRGRAWLVACSVPLYYLALLGKEHAVMLPAVLVALVFVLNPDWKAALWRYRLVWVGHLVLAGLVVMAKAGLLGQIYEPTTDQMLMRPPQWAYPLSVLTQAGLYFKYLMLWLLPQPRWMSIDMQMALADTLRPGYALGLAAYVAVGAGSIYLMARRGSAGLLGFALFYPWVMFWTEFSSVRIQEIFVLYRSYLWAAGLFCAVPVVFKRVEARSAVTMVVLLAGGLFIVAKERLTILTLPLFVWDDAARLVQEHEALPGSYRIYYNRGYEYWNQGMVEPAIQDFNKAIALNPRFAESYANLGALYANQQDWQKAAPLLQQAIDVAAQAGRGYAIAEGNLGLVQAHTGAWEAALASFTRAIELDQKDGKSPAGRDVLERAKVHEHLGHRKEAQADYAWSCRIDKRGCEKAGALQMPQQAGPTGLSGAGHKAP